LERDVNYLERVMPHKNRDNTKTTFTPPSVGANVSRGHGRRTVHYRDAKGQTWEALVVGPGTASGLKLQLTSHPRRGIIDNVANATARTDTGKYFDRSQ
jgi:hypothetical protein